MCARTVIVQPIAISNNYLLFFLLLPFFYIAVSCVFLCGGFQCKSTKMDMDSDLSEYLNEFYADIIRAEANLQYFAHVVSTSTHYGHDFLFIQLSMI